jgi:molybdopterin synthase sulfur carrier subunit
MEVLLFGIAKDIVGASQMVFSSEDEMPNSVADLKRQMGQKFPDFKKLTSFAVAVNSEYAQDDMTLKSNDEIAIIPPVSGG